MKELKKPGVMLYFDTLSILRQMPPEDVYEVLMAIYDYAEQGTEPVFQNMALSYMWGFVRQSIQRDTMRYQSVAEQRRRAAEKRWGKQQTEEDAFASLASP